jgi:hypothetical protein
MSDFQAIADRVEIEALRGEFTDAASPPPPELNLHTKGSRP